MSYIIIIDHRLFFFVEQKKYFKIKKKKKKKRASDWTFKIKPLRARKVMPKDYHRFHLTNLGEDLPSQGLQNSLRFLYMLVR